MVRLSIIFHKGESARFLSHLDLMSTFEYSMRRARLPVELSEGFNPHPRMSAAAPLALGHTGEREILEIALREELPTEEVRQRLQAAVPPGIAILSVDAIPGQIKSAASRVRSATYRVSLPADVPDIGSRLAELLTRDALPIEEERDGKIRRRDLRPLILSLEATGPGTVRMVVRLNSDGSTRPEQILNLLSIPMEGVEIVREQIELAD